MINNDNGSTDTEESENENPTQKENEDVMQILVASDINLGYEQTVKRAEDDDSFRTFEEILEFAKEHDVDAIFLAGNLFYESSPPLNVITKCINLLRSYCFGQKPVKIECITDPEWIFNHYAAHKHTNFADPNLNIRLPIFSIYGHRDSPIFDSIGALDLLAATGLINYFGKWTADPKIHIPPLLLRKGLTTVAFYGLNHMNDDKLSALIKRDKLELLTDDNFDAYNLMILHQNRKIHNKSAKKFVAEALLPDFLDLVIWGHEPESRIELESVPDKKFFVYQLGSTIATSLLKKDAKPKKVAVLKVHRNQLFEINNLQLQTVRPFIFKQLILVEHNHAINKLQEQLNGPISKTRPMANENFVDNYIERILLQEVPKQRSEHPKQPEKPLLRLKICYNDNNDRFDLTRLQRKYQNIIANPCKMIWFSKCSSVVDQNSDVENDSNNESDDEFSEIFLKHNSKNWTRTIESDMSEHFNSEENKDKLTVLRIDKLNEALSLFRRGDNKIFDRTVRKEIKRAVNHLMNDDV